MYLKTKLFPQTQFSQNGNMTKNELTYGLFLHCWPIFQFAGKCTKDEKVTHALQHSKDSVTITIEALIFQVFHVLTNNFKKETQSFQ